MGKSRRTEPRWPSTYGNTGQAFFTAKDIDKQQLQDWLRDTIQPFGKMPEEGWRVKRGHVARAINTTNNSSPGPDGIPYAAWRAVAHLATPILHDVINELRQDDWKERLSPLRDPTGRSTFNRSTLCCLPKKEVGQMPDGTPYYDPADTRPLNIVNTDHRIIANAIRLALENTV